MDSEPAVCRVEGRVGIIVLNRPEQHNCLSTHTFEIMRKGLSRFEADEAIKVVLICNRGKNFCAGADLGELQEALNDQEHLRKFVKSLLQRTQPA